MTIVLCADDEDRLMPTVRSRCTRIRLGPVAIREIEAILDDDGGRRAAAGRPPRPDRLRPARRRAYARSGSRRRSRHATRRDERIAVPARALAQEADGGWWAICFRPGIRHEPDEVAQTAQAQAKFQVLSWADVQTALLQKRVAPIHGTRAGKTGDRAHDVEDGFTCADRHQVLDALKPRPQRVALVADRNVATCAGDARIAERGCKPRNGGQLENCIRINREEQVAAGKPCRGIDRRAAATARAVADDHVDQAECPSPLRDPARAVGGAVVNDDDFERRQGLPPQRSNCAVKPGAAVERRYDHADGGTSSRWWAIASADAE